VHVSVAEGFLEIRLSTWEKILGLLGNIRVPLAEVGDVEVVPEPMREAMLRPAEELAARLREAAGAPRCDRS
jgi:hypothetical protein